MTDSTDEPRPDFITIEEWLLARNIDQGLELKERYDRLIELTRQLITLLKLIGGTVLFMFVIVIAMEIQTVRLSNNMDKIRASVNEVERIVRFFEETFGDIVIPDFGELEPGP